MKVQDILHVKGNAVQRILPDATLQEVVCRLVEHRIGSLLVARTEAADAKDDLLGIITEHDILFASMTGRPPLAQVRVAEMMSKPLVTGAPDDELEKVMGLMTTRRIRHLPILAAERLIGIISIGDVVKAQHDWLAMENRFMKDYIGTQ